MIGHLKTRFCPLFASLLFSICIAAPIKPAAQTNELFRPAPGGTEASMTPGQRRLLRLLRRQETTQALNLVQVTRQSIRDVPAVEINLPRVGKVQFIRKDFEERGSNEYVWIGETNNDAGSAVLVFKGDQITGHVEFREKTYAVRPLGGGLHALILIDATKFPKDHPSSMEPRPPASPDIQPGPTPTTLTQIEVLVAYTSAAKKANNNTIAGLPDLAVFLANRAYRASKIDVELRLVGIIKVDYEEANVTNPLQDLVAARGVMAKVHAERTATGADIVLLLLRPNLDACGLAPVVLASANTAFAVVSWPCIDNHSAAHEIGHLFGALHDPETNPQVVPFPYGHGYISPDRKWRTIMAYGQPCGNCGRIGQFSDPDNLYNGQPTGTPDISNVARVHRERAIAVANFLSPAPIALPPVALKATDVNSRRFIVRWNASLGARYYLLDVTDDPHFLSIPLHNIHVRSSVNPPGWPVSVWKAATTYYYRLRAVNAAGVPSEYSNVETVKTKDEHRRR